MCVCVCNAFPLTIYFYFHFDFQTHTYTLHYSAMNDIVFAQLFCPNSKLFRFSPFPFYEVSLSLSLLLFLLFSSSIFLPRLCVCGIGMLQISLLLSSLYENFVYFQSSSLFSPSLLYIELIFSLSLSLWPPVSLMWWLLVVAVDGERLRERQEKGGPEKMYSWKWWMKGEKIVQKLYCGQMCVCVFKLVECVLLRLLLLILMMVIVMDSLGFFGCRRYMYIYMVSRSRLLLGRSWSYPRCCNMRRSRA